MKLELEPVSIESDHRARNPSTEDVEGLTVLMTDSFRDGRDSSGWIGNLFANEYGEFRPELSFVIEQDGVLVSAALVTEFPDSLELAFVMTHPDYRRRGLSEFVIRKTINGLLEGTDHEFLMLDVDVFNATALKLYAKLGFKFLTDGFDSVSFEEFERLGFQFWEDRARP